MKKNVSTLIIILAIIFSNSTFAQEKYLDKNGVVIFEASEKLFEEVKATNTTVTAIYDTATNQFAALALMKAFRFKNSLMEEHFNENYIESETYPKAKFKGTILDFDPKKDLNENASTAKIKGILNIRGKEKEIETTLTIQKAGDTVAMQGEFIVTPEDFAIEIPNIVRNKIAKEVTVSLNFKLKRK